MNFEVLKIAYSTCPNDTFMFDALINRKIDSEKLSFDVRLADIEELNKSIARGEPDISKISFAAYPEISKEYQFLHAGSALGFGNGPLIISKHKIYPDELMDVKLGIPGKKTTANFLVSILFPEIKSKKEYLFSDIEDAILTNEIDAGLIIHETRFTYEKKGLKKIADLGELWEEKFQLPIPLGGIVIRRSLSGELKRKVENKVAESIKFGFENPESSMRYIKSFAQELSDDVVRRHIDLYVNNFSIDLAEKGIMAIQTLFEKGIENKLFEKLEGDIFI